MKLWELRCGDYFTIDAGLQVPPGAPPVAVGLVYRLGNIDGMYSYCCDQHGDLVHILADADVTPHSKRIQ